MKPSITLLLLLCTILFTVHCNPPEAQSLYGHSWELEYLSGPRIAFHGLFPDKKPTLSFSKDDQKVTGQSGCNGYNAGITVTGNSIAFGEPGPTTMMYCGEGETHFLNTLKKVNRFQVTKEGELELFMDDVPMMRFKKAVVAVE